jgi:hypothetical protein
MGRIIEISSNNDNKWNNYINLIPKDKCDIYFNPNYINFFAKPHESVSLFCFEEGNNAMLVPYIKRKINSLGYTLDKEYFDLESVYGYTGYTSNCQEPEFVNSFFSSFNKYCTANNIVAEFCRYSPLLNNQNLVEKNRSIIFDRSTITIDLNETYEQIWTKQYSSKNRNIIRKAGSYNYQFKMKSKPDLAEIEEFVEIYYHSMINSNADEFYFFEKESFIELFEKLPNNAFIASVKDFSNETISVAIILQHYDVFHYHLSGRTAKANNTTTNFLLDQCIQFAKEMGGKRFHLGGGRTSSESDSLFKFKKSFGHVNSKFHISKTIHNKEIYNTIVEQWEKGHPELIEKYDKHILKYRNQ